MIETAAEIATASTADLLETYAAFIGDAKLLEERGHHFAAKVAADAAYSIAVEIERRATPIDQVVPR